MIQSNNWKLQNVAVCHKQPLIIFRDIHDFKVGAVTILGPIPKNGMVTKLTREFTSLVFSYEEDAGCTFFVIQKLFLICDR